MRHQNGKNSQNPSFLPSLLPLLPFHPKCTYAPYTRRNVNPSAERTIPASVPSSSFQGVSSAARKASWPAQGSACVQAWLPYLGGRMEVEEGKKEGGRERWWVRRCFLKSDSLVSFLVFLFPFFFPLSKVLSSSLPPPLPPSFPHSQPYFLSYQLQMKSASPA